MPFSRTGHGARPLVVFQDLMFENKPPSKLLNRMYKFLEEDYTVYSVLRKPNMPHGYTLQDMANDYATMIQDEFSGLIDVIGISTGGSIVQHFAADHPFLTRRLVIHSSAHTLNDYAKRLQLQIGYLAQNGEWRKANEILVRTVLPRSGVVGILSKPLVLLSSILMSINVPDSPTDLVGTVQAEDQHNFKNRLAEITAPTLVIAGTQDPFYSVELFRETAEGIQGAILVLYEGMGHPASGKQFARDVLSFLKA